MTHDIIRGVNRYTAGEGKGFIGKNETGIVQSTELWLGGTSVIDDYLELPIGTNYGGAMKYSRWGIIKALEKRGLADAFDAYLDANKAAFRRFYGPTNFRADDADFKEMIKTLQGAFKLSDEDVAAILAESPYTPDV